MELAPPTRLFALIDRDAAPGPELEGPLTLDMVELHLSGAQAPPWQVLGLTKDGGISPLADSETLAEAKAFAERRVPARGVWQPMPARPQSGSYMTSLLPEHRDWRVENVEQELRGAEVHWTRFEADLHSDHGHRSGCWATFGSEDDPNINNFGFRTPAERWLCEQCYHDLKEYLRLRTVLP